MQIPPRRPEKSRGRLEIAARGGPAARKAIRISEEGKLSRGERSRARLIGAAIEEFAANGYHGAKISDIVARAGLTQPSFYMYFVNKDAIYDYLLSRVRSELMAIVRSVRVPSHLPKHTAEEKIIAAIAAFLQYFVDNPKLARIGYFQAPSSMALRKDVTALVSRNVASEQDAGYFRSDFDPLFLSECYNGALDRLIESRLLSGECTAAELAKRVFDIFQFGMTANQPRRRTVRSR
jgi:TetR/AcrR family transcriptional regulator, fatty acid metabolism regulator protein